MEIRINITEKENELLKLLKKKGSISAQNYYDGWEDTEEFKEFSKNKLIYNCTAGYEGSWIKYALTELGKNSKYRVVKNKTLKLS